MPGKSFFHFKQFSIHQDRSAMKVTSDACIFGAYLRAPLSGRILDIGTGTGLLTLMLAQRSNDNVFFDAVEIDPQTGTQACSNIEKSPWSKRINVHLCPIQNFTPPSPYEMIVCNPPFYNQEIKSRDEQKRKAWHAGHLDHMTLVELAGQWISESGSFHLILPCSEEDRFSEICEKKGLIKQASCYLLPYADRPPNRVFSTFGKSPSISTSRNLVVYSQHQVYSKDCTTLLKPYFTSL